MSGDPRTGAPLSEEAIDVIATRLRVVAEPTRIRLLELLNAGEATVQELCDQLPTTHQNVSRHLATLHQAGMVSRRKEANTVRYALVDWTGWWLVEQMASSISARAEELGDLFSSE
ncbi:MAG: metalloregulator ArsR/SmtB family transcription factor [Solirubrobacteraceae bacterium]|nr:metalloregulator ArsR/SmtB family transcription factor [Solirubrobacteraceae bacterium]